MLQLKSLGTGTVQYVKYVAQCPVYFVFCAVSPWCLHSEHTVFVAMVDEVLHFWQVSSFASAVLYRGKNQAPENAVC